ncbi:MAG: NusG domain II-containing protein [Clostridia bacterium]|nr:NusG domain II-containing protein [Clostridia bacterium]
MESGRIRVSAADYPDQVCVHQGWQSTGAMPIVCLPNKLVIQLVQPTPGTAGETALDGVIQ